MNLKWNNFANIYFVKYKHFHCIVSKNSSILNHFVFCMLNECAKIYFSLSSIIECYSIDLEESK